MGAILATILRSFLTEKVLKIVLITLGDFLVLSSKNKLDDALWEKVKNVLQK